MWREEESFEALMNTNRDHLLVSGVPKMFRVCPEKLTVRPAGTDVRTEDIAPVTLCLIRYLGTRASSVLRCLTSSWIRSASFLLGSDILAGSPKQ